MPRIPNVLVIAAISAASAVIGVATASSASAAPSASAAGSHTLNVVRTSVGKILVDRNGLTLYLFTRDSRDKDKCAAISGCTAVWPAYTTAGKPTAGPGVNASLLGTIKQGSREQVAYDGHPLYEYAQNNNPGATGYIDTPEFGGTWDAVSPTGKAVSG
jgi:predicted lipoprotein with Yx(FWY)xxD motif